MNWHDFDVSISLPAILVTVVCVVGWLAFCALHDLVTKIARKDRTR